MVGNHFLGDGMLFTNKQLRALILPLVIEQTLVMTVGMADTMMISSVGEAAISGVALVDMVNQWVSTIFAALATGGAVIVSQYLGDSNRAYANKSADQLIMVSFLLSSAVMGLCLAFYKGILNLLFGSVDQDVMDAAVMYFFISSLSFPFLGVYSSSAALFRSMSKTNITMYVSFLMNVINIAGNALGIFVFRAGVAGVAVPTVIARIVAALLLTGLAGDRKNQLFISIKGIFSWQKDIAKRILRIAVPNGIENRLFQLGRVLVTSIVALFGTSQIAAYGVAGSVDMISIIVASAVNLAIVTVVGQCVGARDYDRAALYTKKLMFVSWISTGILGIAVIILLPFILKLYALSDETVRYAFILIAMHNILVFLLNPTSFVLGNSLRAAGDVRFTMYAGIGSIVVFRLGSALLFGVALNLGVIGVWIAMGMDWSCRSVCFLLRYRSGRWKNYRAI
jgi:putative MATE family efflux protein